MEFLIKNCNKNFHQAANKASFQHRVLSLLKRVPKILFSFAVRATSWRTCVPTLTTGTKSRQKCYTWSNCGTMRSSSTKAYTITSSTTTKYSEKRESSFHLAPPTRKIWSLSKRKAPSSKTSKKSPVTSITRRSRPTKIPQKVKHSWYWGCLQKDLKFLGGVAEAEANASHRPRPHQRENSYCEVQLLRGRTDDRPHQRH